MKKFYQWNAIPSDVILSNITVRENNHRQKRCREKPTIKQFARKIISSWYNTIKHLDKRVSEILSNTFIESVSNISHWQNILRSSDNFLMDYYKAGAEANLSSIEKLSILYKRNTNKIIVSNRNINSFLANVPFLDPWQHQKPSSFLVFSNNRQYWCFNGLGKKTTWEFSHRSVHNWRFE